MLLSCVTSSRGKSGEALASQNHQHGTRTKPQPSRSQVRCAAPFAPLKPPKPPVARRLRTSLVPRPHRTVTTGLLLALVFAMCARALPLFAQRVGRSLY